MSSILINHPNVCFAQDIEAICAPLKKLNITYFAHARITLDKKFSTIGTNPAFTEHYIKNKYYALDIHMADDKRFGNFFVWDGIDFSEKLCAEASSLGVNNPFTIIHRGPNGTDYYHFANDSSHKQINQVYLANIDLLQLFISHFNENIKQSKSLYKAYDLTFDLQSHHNIDFEDPSISFNRSQFLQDIQEKKLAHLQIADSSLTKRQSEVLQWVLCGKTIKETSKILGLSERTVGHYFENIKNKLNVDSRSELISKLINPTLLQAYPLKVGE